MWYNKRVRNASEETDNLRQQYARIVAEVPLSGKRAILGCFGKY